MSDKTLNVVLINRNDTTTNWSTNNPILKAGEIGVVANYGAKIGDGSSAWNSLGYINSWDKIIDKPSSFTPSSHTHNYLPLDGGVMTGTIERYSINADYDFFKFGHLKTDDAEANWAFRYKGSTNDIDGNEFVIYSAMGSWAYQFDHEGHFEAVTGDNIYEYYNSNNIPFSSTSKKGIVQLNNTLTSTSTVSALTANQGKVLQDTKVAKSGDTMTGTLILKGSTSADMTNTGNVHPRISFRNSGGSQTVDIIYTDYDSYRAPAGIKVIGNQGNEWFEAASIYATTFTGSLNGNASSATKLKTARTIEIDGSVTGSATFDGSKNITITTSTNHSHSYLPLAGGTMTGATIINYSNIYIYNNVCKYTGSGTVTGTIKLTMPKSWSNTMFTVYITVFNYSTGTSGQVIVSGYNYSVDSTWCEYSAYSSSSQITKVRVGHDGSKCCILLNETTSTWSYPKITIDKVIAGHSNYDSFSDWSISVITDESAYTKIQEVTLNAGFNADLLDGKHASAFALSGHTHNYLPLSGGTMTGATIINYSNIYIYNNVCKYTGSGTVTGTIKLTMPKSWSNTMFTVYITVFNYSTGTSGQVIVSGYNYSVDSTWCEYSAYSSSSQITKVRVGHDGSKCCILLNETTSTWSYPKITIDKVIAGHSNYDSFSDWSISVITDESAYTKIQEVTLNAGFNADLLDGKHASAFALSGHTHNYLPLSGGTITGPITTPNSAMGIKLGDDSQIGDVSIANMMGLQGQQDATGGGIVFGSGKDTNLYRAGANSLKTDDTFTAYRLVSTVGTGTAPLTVSSSTVVSNLNADKLDGLHATTFVKHRQTGYDYTDLASGYWGGTAPTYVRIKVPTALQWTMVCMELLIRQSYSPAKYGKLFISGHTYNGGGWSNFNCFSDGTLTTSIAVYGISSTTEHYFYIAGISSYSSVVVSKMTCGDSVIDNDISAVVIDSVTELPEGYGTATMYRGLTSENYTTYTDNNYLKLSGGSLSGKLVANNGINLNHADNDGISFYSTSYVTWFEYMNPSGSGKACTGGIAPAYGDVTSWARRSTIENFGGYGWIWDSCANSSGANPDPKMSLSSSNGNLTVKGSIYSASGYLKATTNSCTITIGSQNTGYCHYETTAPSHWFNKVVKVCGEIYAGSSYNQKVWHANEQIYREGISTSWYNGRTYSLLRTTTAPGYSPTLSIKTTNGSWEMGHYAVSGYNDMLLFTYILDSNFNSGTNTMSAQIKISGEGYIYANRVYNAIWNDYAELFEKEDEKTDFKAGYIIETNGEDKYRYTTKANSPYVVGVISDNYGHLLGGSKDKTMEENAKENIPVGVAGRLEVYITGKIKAGDLITSSDIKGVGMKSTRKIKGSIVGKALESKDTEEIGKVKMLILNM